MEIKEMQMSDIEQRSLEIEEAVKDPNADLDALAEEVKALEERKAQIEAEVEQRKKEAEEVLKSAEVIEPIEERKMENIELRNTPEYIDAFAEYIKGNDKEMRVLLSTNATNGTVEIPDYVSDRIRADWDKLPLLSRVRRVSIKGDYTVQYEASASGAVKHTEGAAAPAEETLELGSVKFISEFYKKWIKVSDTVLALRGEAFLDYLLKEFEHQIGLALENAIVAEIEASSLAAAVTNPIDNTAAMAGFAALSDEAANPVVIISKANYAAIMNERTTAGDKIADPFNGMEVLFNNTVTGMLVGDLNGVEVNFPDGYEFKYIIDEKTYAEQDLVKIVGKVLASMHLVQPNGFAVVKAS